MGTQKHEFRQARSRTDGPPLAIISKSRDERIHVTLTVFDGIPYVDVRVHSGTSGRDVPTTRGLAISVETFAKFTSALKQCERKVRAFGLLDEKYVRKQTRG